MNQNELRETMTYIEQLLDQLLHIPSPSGHTERIIRFLEHEVAALGLSSTLTKKGALLIHVPGVNDDERRAITAHVDTLGAMVKEITDIGRIKLSMIGGYAWSTIDGENCTIETMDGPTYSGTVLLHNTSVHVNRKVDETVRSADNLEIVLDAIVRNRSDVHALGIQVGDFISFDPRVRFTETGYIKSRHLDDKASVAIILGLLRAIKQRDIPLPHTLEVLISNNEEIGYGGNSNIGHQVVEYVAVDMGAIGDGQSTDEYCVSICAKDASGPYHEGLRKKLISLARKEGLHYVVDIYPYYNSDVSAALRAGMDIVHGLIGPGVANSHAYERTHRDAINNTFRLLQAYVESPLLRS